MLVQTEITPNPNTLKFLPGKRVSEAGTIEFYKKDKNISVDLAKNILSLNGTELVFFAETFITVKKEEDTAWEDLKYNIISMINNFYSQGNESVIKKDFKKIKDIKIEDSNTTIIKIKEVLDNKVRPAVARDGGDIKFQSFVNGIVRVELQGSCSGCPSSVMTLKQGVENLLKHYVPEVKSVEAV